MDTGRAVSLDGMTAVVTGAAHGIGRACAERLAHDGAAVAILDLDPDGLAETARLVEASGRRCLPVTVDLTDRAAVVDAFATVRRELGPVSVLHSNAGGFGGPVRSFLRSEPEQWDRVTHLNLDQNVDCVRQVVGDMAEAGYGRIIVTSSEMAFRAGFGTVDYAAAKAGLLGFVRNLANELGRHQITVNAVCPGMTRTALAANLDEEQLARTLRQIPLGRIGEPEEIAHAVSFLASPGASYITGEALLVTGGRTLH